MRRIDRYWKRCAAGMMVALTLMLGQGTMQSFAMNAQVVTSPNKIIVRMKHRIQTIRITMEHRM